MVIKYGVDFEKIIQIFYRQIHNNRFIPFLCYQDPSSLCHYFFKAQEKENGNHFKCSKNHNLESFFFFFFLAQSMPSAYIFTPRSLLNLQIAHQQGITAI